jgi:hypothetical protein
VTSLVDLFASPLTWALLFGAAVLAAVLTVLLQNHNRRD